jgi:D-tyrosyl-tRNA(Tyr) deacylase
MRAVVQKVKKATVVPENAESNSIGKGLVIFLGVGQEDTQEDGQWLVKKIVNMRIFEDEEGKMNQDLKTIDGELMVVSQFTLQASTKKGNRPSFIRAAGPDTAIPLYESFINECEVALGKKVATGVFGAQMDVSLVNEGPVTIWLDSRNKG